MPQIEQWMRDAAGEIVRRHLGYEHAERVIASAYEKGHAPTTPATPKWGGTQQRDDLKPCPFCGTRAVSQGRLADNSTEQQWRIMCGNPFCTMQCMTHTCASFSDAVRNWESRVAEAAPTAGELDPNANYGPTYDHLKSQVAALTEALTRISDIVNCGDDMNDQQREIYNVAELAIVGERLPPTVTPQEKKSGTQ